MALKSLLNQARQIKASKSFTDIELGTDNAGRKTLVEGQEFLEQDINVLRSMIKDITGAPEWQDLPATTLTELALTADKKVLQPVQYAQDGINGTSIVTTLDVNIPGITNNTGTTDIGYILDDTAIPSVISKARVTLRDKNTNQILVNAAEKVIYGIASNNGTDKIQVKFYTDVNGTATEATITGDVEMILAYRERLDSISKESLLVNAGFAGSVGAFELGDRVYIDVDDNGTPVFGFIVDKDITETVNKLAQVAGTDKILGDNISTVSGITATNKTTFKTDDANSNLEDGDNLIIAITKLDTLSNQLKEDIANVSGDEVSEILAADIAEGVEYTIPGAKTYLNTDKDAITIFLNGVKMASDLVIGDGSVGNGDYTPFSTTTIKFNLPLEATDLITCVITKA